MTTISTQKTSVSHFTHKFPISYQIIAMS